MVVRRGINHVWQNVVSLMRCMFFRNKSCLYCWGRSKGAEFLEIRSCAVQRVWKLGLPFSVRGIGHVQACTCACLQSTAWRSGVGKSDVSDFILLQRGKVIIRYLWRSPKLSTLLQLLQTLFNDVLSSSSSINLLSGKWSSVLLLSSWMHNGNVWDGVVE